jgi:hypothetical protein
VTFKGRYDGATPATNAPAAKEEKTAPKEEAKPVPEAASATNGVQYGIQVLATGKDMDLNDPYFMGHRPLVIQVGKLKKYVICTSDSLAEVKKKFPQIQKKIKDSYIVRIENGTTTPVH